MKNLYGLITDNGYLCIVDLVEDVGFKDVVTNIFYNDVKVVGASEINYYLFLSYDSEKVVGLYLN